MDEQNPGFINETLMLKLYKLTSSQYFGFWWIGLLIFLIQELPYIIMPFLSLPSNPIMNMEESSLLLNIFEKILGSSCVATMILVNHQDAKLFSVVTKKEKLFFGLTIFVLVLNFFGWFLYDTGLQPIWVMMVFLVTMPPLYYIFVGLWRRNYILVMFGVPFFIDSFHTCNG